MLATASSLGAGAGADEPTKKKSTKNKSTKKMMQDGTPSSKTVVSQLTNGEAKQMLDLLGKEKDSFIQKVEKFFGKFSPKDTTFEDASDIFLKSLGVHGQVTTNLKEDRKDGKTLFSLQIRYNIADGNWNSGTTPIIMWLLRGTIIEVLVDDNTSNVETRVIIPMVKFLEPKQTGRDAKKILTKFVNVNVYIAPKADGTLIIQYLNLLGDICFATMGSLDAGGKCGDATFGKLAARLIKEKVGEGRVRCYELLHESHPTNPHEPSVVFLGEKGIADICFQELPNAVKISPEELLKDGINAILHKTGLLADDQHWFEGACVYVQSGTGFFPILKMKDEAWEIAHYLGKQPITVEKLLVLLGYPLEVILAAPFHEAIKVLVEALKKTPKLLDGFAPKQTIPCIPNVLEALADVKASIADGEIVMQLDFDDTTYVDRKLSKVAIEMIESFIKTAVSLENTPKIVLCSGRSAKKGEDVSLVKKIIAQIVAKSPSAEADMFVLALYPDELRDGVPHSSVTALKVAFSQVICPTVAVDDKGHTLMGIKERMGDKTDVIQSVVWKETVGKNRTVVTKHSWIRPLLTGRAKDSAKHSNKRTSAKAEMKAEFDEETLEKARQIIGEIPDDAEKTLIITVGPPGVGKTTLTQAIISSLEAVCVLASADEHCEVDGQLDPRANLSSAHKKRVESAMKGLTQDGKVVVFYDSVAPDSRDVKTLLTKADKVIYLDFVSPVVNNVLVLQQLWSARVFDFLGAYFSWGSLLMDAKVAIQKIDRDVHTVIEITPWAKGVKCSFVDVWFGNTLQSEIEKDTGLCRAKPPMTTPFPNRYDLTFPNGLHLTLEYFADSVERWLLSDPKSLDLLGKEFSVKVGNKVTVKCDSSYKGKPTSELCSFHLAANPITGETAHITTQSGLNAPAGMVGFIIKVFGDGFHINTEKVVSYRDKEYTCTVVGVEEFADVWTGTHSFIQSDIARGRKIGETTMVSRTVIKGLFGEPQSVAAEEPDQAAAEEPDHAAAL
jgi:hypothetical protein